MERTLRRRGCGINCKCGGLVRCQFVKLWDLSRYSEKSNIQEAYLPKTSISGQFVSEMLAHTNPSKLTQVKYEVTGGTVFRIQLQKHLVRFNEVNEKE